MTIRSILAAAAVAAIVTPALAQQAEDAKATLTESAKAMKEVSSVTFDAKKYGTGMLKDFIDCDGKVMVMRSSPTAAPTFKVEGRIKQPGAGDKHLTYVNDGANARWLDQKDNKLMERTLSDANATQELSLAKQLIPEEYFSPEPFGALLKMDKLAKLPNDTVNGEVCDIVQGSTADGSRSITWAISARDRLPRRMEMATGQGDTKLAMILEMTNVDTSRKLAAKDFEIALPTGYVVDKGPVNTANPAAANQQPAAEIGLAAGTPAPNFVLKDSGGKEITLEGLRGNVVVLEFFGTMFKASNIGSLDIQSMASGEFKGKNVKFIGMACREPNEAAPKEYFSDNGLTYTLVPKADAAVDEFKVKGFPSYYVIDAKGNVAAFFQTWPGKDVIASAVNQAMQAN